MKSERFKDFQNTLKMLQFFNVRYTKVFHLKFCKDDLHTLEYTLLQLEKKCRQSDRCANNIHPDQVIESMIKTDIKILISRKQKCDKKLFQAK